MSEINNYLEYINQNAELDSAALIKKSEQRYSQIISSLSERMLDSHGHRLVMLAGPSSSGKTTTALKFIEAMGKNGIKAYRVSLDDFYLDKSKAPRLEDGSPDLESVHSLDLPLLTKTLDDLVDYGESEIPLFDFMLGRRSDKTDYIKLDKDDVIVVEGLHALNPLITDELNTDRVLKMYVSVSSRIYDENQQIILNKRNLRFVRRMVRDYKFRASSVEHTYGLWKSVLRGEDMYLTPYKKFADVLINSIHIYEPCVFRSVAIPLLQHITEDSPYYQDSKKLIKSLECFTPLSADLVPDNSLMREFLGSRPN